MLFSSIFFLLCFFPVFFSIYFVLPVIWKNYFIVFSSLLFYAWGAPTFIFVLIATIIFNFYAAKAIFSSVEKKQKLFFIVSIVLNVSILIYFKYFNFFIDNYNHILKSIWFNPVNYIEVILPIGISFFTFHQLSFIIDVYRKIKPPPEKISDYALYILLFPQLIAGPIVRYNEISDQIQGRDKRFDIDQVLSGFLRFTIGLSKKVLIANTLGFEADKIFDLPADQLYFAVSWIGAIAYTFQIYFDFSGYSDMAIGLAKMMGFRFPENFNQPYRAQSITDFWKRWHISLSRWMKDYLYIPLGGNKVSKGRLYLNLWIVFLISGFWHGAEWTFVLWGIYHGCFLVADRLFFIKSIVRIGTVLRIIITFFIVVIGWVIFRAESLNQAFCFLESMVTISSQPYLISNQILLLFVIAGLLSFLPLPNLYFEKYNKTTAKVNTPLRSFAIVMFIVLAMILCTGEIASTDFNPFIYFKF